VVVVSTIDRDVEVENALMTRLRLDGPVPRVWIDEEVWTASEANGPLAAWSLALLQLLKAWIAG
jgi:hypothetical protein